MGVLVFNPQTVAVVIDTPGHILGGGEWLTVDPADQVTQALIDSKRVRIVPEKP